MAIPQATIPSFENLVEKERHMRIISRLVVGLLISFQALALDLSGLSNADAGSGLKDALTQGSAVAVAKLGAENGFLGNEKVRIPLPDALKRVEGMLRVLGMQKQTEELVTAMNRAAEQAVPEAKALLVNAVKNMSWQDAKGILTGSDTAATEYFRRTTSDQLIEKFLPIVTKATTNVGLAEKYNEIAGKGAKLGLVDARQARIENYVTQKTLDGLFLMMAEQEKAIRADPIGATTAMARRVFGLTAK
ncbi:MAG: DUF4197 domain-containing protein [Rhodoferax sp.]